MEKMYIKILNLMIFIGILNILNCFFVKDEGVQNIITIVLIAITLLVAICSWVYVRSNLNKNEK